jgi:hypothetical protein
MPVPSASATSAPTALGVRIARRGSILDPSLEGPAGESAVSA